jgi:hypothetical protein
MKQILAVFMLMFAVNAFAQFTELDLGGMPTIPVERQLCIQHDEEEHLGRTIQRTASTQENACLRATGSPKIVVCLAQFPDVKFTVAQDKEALMQKFDTFFNGKGIGAGDNTHSVADYFRGMSNEAFTPEFVITEPVTLSQNRSYYGNSMGASRRTTFRNEALDLLASQIADRVEELDTNDDGKVDGVIIVFTGCGANVGDKNGMHPACWTSSLTRKKSPMPPNLSRPNCLVWAIMPN